MSESGMEPPRVVVVPRSIIRCLPELWRGILFPGTESAERSIRAWRLVVLLVGPALLLYPCLSFLLFEPDEGRYAEIPREMLARGEWIIPYLQGEPYLDKPPLLYWLVMASFRFFGVHDWSARLVPALAVHATVLVIYLLGRRSVGERAAFWGALTLALVPGFMSIGRLLVIDGLLALWIALALLLALEAVRCVQFRWSWWLAAAAATGFGVLTKGPIALVLVIPPLVMHMWLVSSPVRIGLRGWLFFAVAISVIALPWYLVVCWKLPEFGGHFFVKHNLLRFFAPFDHIEPVWYYVPLIAAGMLPASLLGIGWLRYLFTANTAVTRQRTVEQGYLLLAAGWCVAFFSLSGSKLPTYILPALPPLALAFGCYIAGSRWVGSVWAKMGVGVTFLMLGSVHYFVVPWYAAFHSPMSRHEVVADYCADSPVICYPRNCDSAAFYLGRDDLRSFRSKETPQLVDHVSRQPRTVVLFTHRHSPEGLGLVLEASGMRLTRLTPISRSWVSWRKEGYCYMGVIENPNAAW